MAVKKRTVVEAVQAAPDGSLTVLFHLRLEEGGMEITHLSHRFSIPPGMDIDHAVGQVSHHLLSLELPNGNRVTFPQPYEVEVDKIKAVAADVWTPELLAWQAGIREANRARDAEAAEAAAAESRRQEEITAAVAEAERAALAAEIQRAVAEEVARLVAANEATPRAT